jgi:hypothetical protein
VLTVLRRALAQEAICQQGIDEECEATLDPIKRGFEFAGEQVRFIARGRFDGVFGLPVAQEQEVAEQKQNQR